MPRDPGMELLYCIFQGQKVLFFKSCTVHVPSSVQEIVGLIHKKAEVFLFSIGKKAPEVYEGVKYIVVVTDYGVCKKAHVQRRLKGADLVLFCILYDRIPVKGILAGQKVVDSIIYPVVVPFCIGAGLGVTVSFILIYKAYLVPGSDVRGLYLKSLGLSHGVKGLHCHGSSDGLGC